jgi:VRR-NUC domain
MSLATRQAWLARLFGGDPVLEPGPRRQNQHPEQGVLNAVLKVLRTHPKVSWAVRMNSGAYKMPDGRFVRFGFPGCPDLLGQMRDGRILMIEVKAAKGRLTDDQEFMLAKVKANNGVSGVARSIEDAMAIVEG